ncbi:MAG: carbohydrate ABC transporter permease [Lachnospiraceae bacterium]|nr:carbohydrate ABC transporter permease [Lachnospiraceae bacterium]MDO5550321.1 carbohydrate ABC transporter permease [Lachnospiraceae bacterium]
MKKQKIRQSMGSRVFDIVNVAVLGLVAVIMLVPFIHVMAASFTSVEEYLSKDFILFPTTFSLESYRYIFSTGTILHGLMVSSLVTIAGTCMNLLMSVLTAYPLAHRDLFGRKVMIMLVIFTLMFNGGMIPMFIVVQKLGLLNSYASLILPYVISSFNLMLFKNYFQELPVELEEAAKMDGYNDLSILFLIILPLSKPLLATFAIIFGVEHWNSWFNAMLYLSDSGKWPIQVILRQIVLSASEVGDAMGGANFIPPATVRMCTIVVATLPILCIYPFLQKYFTKGLLVGSVKG